MSNIWPEAQAKAVGVVGEMAGFILAKLQGGDATLKKLWESGDLQQLQQFFCKARRGKGHGARRDQ